MGTYVYGVKAKTFKTPIGEVNASQYLYKDGWRYNPPKSVKMLMGRIEAKYAAKPPTLVVCGNPVEYPGEWMGIHKSERGWTIFDDASTTPAVGWIRYWPSGKVDFSETYPG